MHAGIDGRRCWSCICVNTPTATYSLTGAPKQTVAAKNGSRVLYSVILSLCIHTHTEKDRADSRGAHRSYALVSTYILISFQRDGSPSRARSHS